MDELSPRARAYLDAYAQRQPCPTAPPPMRAAPRSITPWRFVVPMIGIAAVAVAGWGATRSTATQVADAQRFEAAPDRADPPPVFATATPAEQPATRSITRAPAATAVAAPEPPSPPVREHVRRVRPRVEPGSTLREELALLDGAKAELRAGDRAAARRAIERHAERFPDGLLAPERRRLSKRIDEETEPRTCVHSSCVGSDDKQESTR